VNRRHVLLAFSALAATSSKGFAQAGTEAAYRDVASWLFDLYLERSVQLSVFNLQRVRPGADRVLAPKLPAMVRVLSRHRDAFIEAMDRALREHVPPDVAAALAVRVRTPPVDLDEMTRTQLIAVDSEFRREAQSVIRALTADLGSMMDDALASAPRAN
jgi:hypothetical protein